MLASFHYIFDFIRDFNSLNFYYSSFNAAIQVLHSPSGMVGNSSHTAALSDVIMP